MLVKKKAQSKKKFKLFGINGTFRGDEVKIRQFNRVALLCLSTKKQSRKGSLSSFNFKNIKWELRAQVENNKIIGNIKFWGSQCETKVLSLSLHFKRVQFCLKMLIWGIGRPRWPSSSCSIYMTSHPNRRFPPASWILSAGGSPLPNRLLSRSFSCFRLSFELGVVPFPPPPIGTSGSLKGLLIWNTLDWMGYLDDSLMFLA